MVCVTLDAHIAQLVQTAVADAVRTVLADLNDRPLVVSADEAARLLDVSRRTIDTWIASGVLPRVPHTGRVLIPRTALEAFVEGRRLGTQALAS